jgi:acetylornithine deacetylase
LNEDIIPLIRRLVARDTVSARSNAALIEDVRIYLAGHGIAARVVPNHDGSKANLFATIGPEIAGGVALSGHTDVVPVEGQAWTTEPFALTERDGLLYGRGTADMKSFIAIALALVPAFKRRRLKRPIHLCLSYCPMTRRSAASACRRCCGCLATSCRSRRWPSSASRP